MKKIFLVGKIFRRFFYGNKNIILLFFRIKLKPRWVWFGATDRCNSHCTHCNIWQQKFTEKPLTLNELRIVFSNPLLKDIECIINSGGEAILRDDIVDIIKLEHEIFPKANIDLSTNGILPDRVIKVVSEVLKENIKINIGVSLDGIDEKHDKIRGVPGNFKKVNYLLRELIKIKEKFPEKLFIIIGFTLSEKTVDNWNQVQSYAKNIGVELMAQWYNESSFYGNISNNKNNNIKKFIEIIKQQPDTIIKEKWLKLIKNKSIKFKCFAAHTFFVLKCDGGVAPCLSYWDNEIGNIREQDIESIWYSQRAEEARLFVKNCSGCLNSWGVEWSITSSFYSRLFFYFKKPSIIIERFKKPY